MGDHHRKPPPPPSLKRRPTHAVPAPTRLGGSAKKGLRRPADSVLRGANLVPAEPHAEAHSPSPDRPSELSPDDIPTLAERPVVTWDGEDKLWLQKPMRMGVTDPYGQHWVVEVPIGTTIDADAGGTVPSTWRADLLRSAMLARPDLYHPADAYRLALIVERIDSDAK